MTTVYDFNGKSYDVDSVDAREYVATGRYFYENPAVKSQQVSTSDVESSQETYNKKSKK